MLPSLSAASLGPPQNNQRAAFRFGERDPYTRQNEILTCIADSLQLRVQMSADRGGHGVILTQAM